MSAQAALPHTFSQLLAVSRETPELLHTPIERYLARSADERTPRPEPKEATSNDVSNAVAAFFEGFQNSQPEAKSARELILIGAPGSFRSSREPVWKGFWTALSIESIPFSYIADSPIWESPLNLLSMVTLLANRKALENCTSTAAEIQIMLGEFGLDSQESLFVNAAGRRLSKPNPVTQFRVLEGHVSLADYPIEYYRFESDGPHKL